MNGLHSTYHHHYHEHFQLIIYGHLESQNERIYRYKNETSNKRIPDPDGRYRMTSTIEKNPLINFAEDRWLHFIFIFEVRASESSTVSSDLQVPSDFHVIGMEERQTIDLKKRRSAPQPPTTVHHN